MRALPWLEKRRQSTLGSEVKAGFSRGGGWFSSVEIGPFAAGQTVKVRTDVGKSRDPSEIGVEVMVVVT